MKSNDKNYVIIAEAWPGFLQQPAAKSQSPEKQGLAIVQAAPAALQKKQQPAVIVQDPPAQLSRGQHPIRRTLGANNPQDPLGEQRHLLNLIKTLNDEVK